MQVLAPHGPPAHRGPQDVQVLKNFVTVRELLDGDDAVDPEAFRIFCGLHRYASTVSYSRVKLAEADAARRDFDAALRAARELR